MCYLDWFVQHCWLHKGSHLGLALNTVLNTQTMRFFFVFTDTISANLHPPLVSITATHREQGHLFELDLVCASANEFGCRRSANSIFCIHFPSLSLLSPHLSNTVVHTHSNSSWIDRRTNPTQWLALSSCSQQLPLWAMQQASLRNVLGEVSTVLPIYASRCCQWSSLYFRHVIGLCKLHYVVSDATWNMY